MTFPGPEDAAMYQAAGLAQLPRMPGIRAMIMRRLQGDAGITEGP